MGSPRDDEGLNPVESAGSTCQVLVMQWFLGFVGSWGGGGGAGGAVAVRASASACSAFTAASERNSSASTEPR
jgi:hypothetical protein